MALSAIIFDIDGTLVDSNHAHLQAWQQSLHSHGYKVASDCMSSEVGKGGDKLVPSILGAEIDHHDGKSLREGHTNQFMQIAGSAQLRLFPGVIELLEQIRKRGFKLAIATSSKQDELKIIGHSAGIDWANYFDVIATGDDAAEGKPAPGILQAAITKLSYSPAQCAIVGDTPYDADAAHSAGVVCIGVTCGGMNDEKTLRSAGMRKVYRDPAAIAEHFNEMLEVASPGPAILTQSVIDSLMREALAAALKGLQSREVPIGCVIARGDGRIIASGHNELNASQLKTAHAEMVAFSRTAGKVPTGARDLILVTTLEPCVMCLGASMEAAVDTILYGLSAPTDGGTSRVRPPLSPDSQMPRLLGGIFADESRRLLEQFLAQRPSNPLQVKFVQELLTLT